MNDIGLRFLSRCFAPDETIALLLRRQSANAPMQRILRFERVREPRYMAWLSYENNVGGNNIYFAANPLRPGTRKRTKESIDTVRHLYLDIDADGDARLASLRASELVPPPTSILSTSPGKYQVLWRVEGFDFARQEQTLKLLAIAFGGDPACTDCNRVLRVPGFLNHKCDPACRVKVEDPDDSVWTPDDFRMNAGTVDALLFAKEVPPRRSPSKHSNQPNPLYYAQRTVDIASARLWFLEGAPIDDVVTMLESRRRFEVPAVMAAARAREIAATAQRMIARKDSA
jgi:hypothetical protein